MITLDFLQNINSSFFRKRGPLVLACIVQLVVVITVLSRGSLQVLADHPYLLTVFYIGGLAFPLLTVAVVTWLDGPRKHRWGDEEERNHVVARDYVGRVQKVNQRADMEKWVAQVEEAVNVLLCRQSSRDGRKTAEENILAAVCALAGLAREQDGTFGSTD